MIIILSSVLLRVNAIQHKLADGIISYAQNSLELPVTIKKVNILSLNKLEVDSILLNDQNGDTLASIEKVVLHLSLPLLLRNKITINNLILGKPTVHINRENDSLPTNAQFIFDLLSSNDSTPSKPLPQIKINQLHLYDGKFSYNVLSAQERESKQFDPSHINIHDITTTISLKNLSTDSINLYIRKISGKEQSGFELTGATAKMVASNNRCFIEGLKIEMPDGYISLKDTTHITYQKNDTTKIPQEIEIRGNIYSRKFTPRNLAAFLPQLDKLPSSIQLSTPFIFSNGKISIDNATIASSNKASSIKYDITFDTKNSSTKFYIDRANIVTNSIKRLYATISDSNIPLQIERLGNISLSGNVDYANNKLFSTLNIESKAGKIESNIKPNATGGHNCTLYGKGIEIGKILDNRAIGKANAMVNITYNGFYENFPQCHIYSNITNLTLNEYQYSPIRVTANIRNREILLQTFIDDKNLESNASLSINLRKKSPTFLLKLDVDTIRPYNLALTKHNSQSIVSFSLESKLDNKANGINLDSAGCTAKIKNLIVRTPSNESNNESKYRKIDNIDIVYNASGERKILTIDSDFINGHLIGDYSFDALHNSYLKVLKKHMPSYAQNIQAKSNNNYVFGIEIKDSKIFEEFILLPFSISATSSISGSCNDQREIVQLNGNLNEITIMNKPFKNIALTAEHKLNGIFLNIKANEEKPTETTMSNRADIEYKCLAHNDTLKNVLIRYTNTNNAKTDISKFLFDVAMFREDNSRLSTSAHIHNSNILFNEQQWNISESHIKSIGNKFEINNLTATNNNRRISIDGTIGESSSDSLEIALNNIILEEILDLVNFHSVSFAGIATGNVTLSGILDTPRFDSNLQVEDFHFEDGYMGNLTVKSNWVESEKAVRLRGIIEDKEYASIVEGIVSPANDSINLQISADGISAGCLNSMISSIVSDVELRAYGDLAVRGKLSSINLYGNLQTIGKLRINSTNTVYNIHGEDTLRFTHNRIGLDNFKIYDHRDSCGVINGSIDHRSLKNFGCTFDIKANNMQAFDTHKYNDDGYYGTAYITGDALLRANKNGLFLNVDAIAQSGSKFIYNSATPLGATNSTFVTFVDRNKKSHTSELPTAEIKREESSNLQLRFKIGVNPDIQLRVYTNIATGDYIDIYGRGTIDVRHNNKEDFKMAGNLEIERGAYKFTLQNIAPKEFAIRSGSIKFNGKPFDAALDLHTAYTIPSVPLTDLSLAGRRNSVRVDCLMDITGTLQEPTLNFGLELPDGNEEERELLSSSTSTPEQINMQFMHLVVIGKFYTYDYNNMGNNQSSTMMESLISSTISGQLNNMLSQITDNDNWDISGNFTTNEKGWNSMEVEGMITGRLLDNRLLINGNLGYRDNPYTDKNFVGDIDAQYIIDKKGIMRIRGYSKTNDRYFSRTDLTTIGVGIMLQHEFNKWMFWKKKKKKDNKQKE